MEVMCANVSPDGMMPLMVEDEEDEEGEGECLEPPCSELCGVGAAEGRKASAEATRKEL